MIGPNLGRYEVLGPLGAGGMGEVYRAFDTRLKRQVAVKLLPAELASNPERLARLEREAQLLASLNHPNIATLHSFGEANGAHFMVLELLEGVTLAARLRRGAMPIPDALDVSRQIAEGLEAAHERGVVHRDLKPANVMVSDRGRIKLLDFGLAKALAPRGPVGAEPSHPTQADLTASGAVLGTAPYMSPEQLRGRDVDHRSDVWAFGCVLYEMLAGVRPFTGETVADTISAVIGSAPEPERLPSATPASIRALLSRCLEKDAELRLDRIGEARRAIEATLRALSEAGEPPGAIPGPGARAGSARGRWRAAGRLVPVGAVATLIIIAGLHYLERESQERSDPLPIRPLTSFEGTEWSASWSPDGSQVAFMHSGSGSADIAVMSVGGGEPHPVATGPHDEHTPRWSPEGSKVAFLSDRGTGLDLHWVPATGGAERRLAATNIAYLERWEGIYAMGANPWSPDGTRLLVSRLSAEADLGIWQVDVGSGRLERMTHPPPGSEDLEASWSPDGRWIAFARWESGRVSLWLSDAEQRQARPLLADAHVNRGPAWTPDGSRLVFFSDRAGSYNLWDIRVEGGTPRQLTAGTGPDYLPVVSSTWKVLFTNWHHQTDLYWLDLEARGRDQVRLTFNTRENYGAEVAADGNRIVYHSDRTGNNEIWLLDRSSGTQRQLTDDSAVDVLPAWSPDGTQVVFVSDRGGSFQPWIMHADGSGIHRLAEHVLPLTADYFEGNTYTGPRWSPDGKLIGYVTRVGEEPQLWLVEPGSGSGRSSGIPGVLRFDWYMDSRRILFVRRTPETPGALALYAAHLASGQERLLIEAPCSQILAAPDGRSAAYVHAAGHFGMNLFRLPLTTPGDPAELPGPDGSPERLTDGGGIWHVHGGAWSPDGRAIVYTRDTDRGDILVLDGYR